MTEALVNARDVEPGMHIAYEGAWRMVTIVVTIRHADGTERAEIWWAPLDDEDGTDYPIEDLDSGSVVLVRTP